MINKLACDIEKAVHYKLATQGMGMPPNMLGQAGSAMQNVAGRAINGMKGLATSAYKHLNYGRESSALYEPIRNITDIVNSAVDKLPFMTTTAKTPFGPWTSPTRLGRFARAGAMDVLTAPIPGIPLKNTLREAWRWANPKGTPVTTILKNMAKRFGA